MVDKIRNTSGSYADVNDLTRFITDEILIALKQPPRGIARRLLGPLLYLPARRFATLMAEGDRRVALNGLVDGARWLLTQIVAGLEMHGVEHVPKEGPVLIAANHPGAYDTVILIAGSGRGDLKMVASDVPFTRALIATAPHLIYISPDDLDAPDRITAIRAGIRHLQDGGALLLYPGSIVDPDPDILSGAEDALKSWSGSLDIFLRHAPRTRVVPAIVGGVLSQRYFHNPLMKIPKTEWEKRKLAEVIQIGHQMISNKPIDLTPRVTFGEASRGEELCNAAGRYRLAVIERARQVLLEHMRRSTTD